MEETEECDRVGRVQGRNQVCVDLKGEVVRTWATGVGGWGLGEGGRRRGLDWEPGAGLPSAKC